MFNKDEYTTFLNAPPSLWAEIKAPSGHVTMVSSPSLDSITYCLSIHAGDRSNETLSETCPFQTAPNASIFSSSPLFLHARKSLRHVRLWGFTINFSFHNASASLPTKLADGSWNCSVPHSSDFLYHLSCNLLAECHDAEDERNCSYTSDFCGPGYLTLGGACFSYVWMSRSETTSEEASEVCSGRRDRLAVLNTVDKYEDAVNLLPLNPRFVCPVFVSIRSMSSSLPLWYVRTYQWGDGTTAFYLNPDVNQAINCNNKHICGCMRMGRDTNHKKRGPMTLNISCDKKIVANILCEKTPSAKPLSTRALPEMNNGTNAWPRGSVHVQCPLGHYTLQFLACDFSSACWATDRASTCKRYQAAPATLLFTCTDELVSVPYTLVCDHREDCLDGSDENFCSFAPCQAGEFSCQKGQCVPKTKECDNWNDCRNGNDEDECLGNARYIIRIPTIPPPALVFIASNGLLELRQLNISSATEQRTVCPNTHFQCLDNGYCLPWILRCNGVYDCAGHEDEWNCEACPDLYRCRASQVCLHYSDLCDGHAHCPQHDDELLCDLMCPSVCVCQGLAFFCRDNFTASAYPQLRFLDASNSVMTPAYLTVNRLLVYLNLANCGLVSLDRLYFPNLHSLNVRDNHLNTINKLHLLGVPQLRELSMAGNPLTLVLDGVEQLGTFGHVRKLDLSRVVIHVLNATAISAAFPNLHDLNLSHSGVQRVLGKGFQSLQQLRVIDLRGCPMKWFPPDVFEGLNNLQGVQAQSFKFCCPEVLPRNFVLDKCFAPSDELSSCENLLRGHLYRVCVAVFSLFGMIGNAVSFIFRTNISKKENKLGYGNLVTHLSLSDLLMGVYLAIIAMADYVYYGTYVWNDSIWKHSVVCQLAGFLSLVSSEVSAFILCLITIDRFLVLRFPFSRLHFSPASANVAALIVWMVGLLLATVPLLPAISHWEFYSQTGICIPLPINRADFAGHDYSFGIFIVLNFAVFVFISIGQLNIYWSVRVNTMSVPNTTKKSKDMTIARRLISVAMTDFLCWFPIGVVALMASNGVPIPCEVNVAMAIFVLPLNSAVNPCLYTINVILERRRCGYEEKLRKLILSSLPNHHTRAV